MNKSNYNIYNYLNDLNKKSNNQNKSNSKDNKKHIIQSDIKEMHNNIFRVLDNALVNG